MMFLVSSLCILVTFAQHTYNGSYVECFNHTDCKLNTQESAQIFCYYGTCTERCPPGYEQKNTDSGWNFKCECDHWSGFVFDGHFPKPFEPVPKCKCVNKTYCNVTVYATGIGYTDGLIPRGKPPNCKIILDKIPPLPITQFSFYLVLGTMIIFMFIHCRSASGVVYDFHRYYGLYVLGSTMVIVFVQTVYPFTAGFTRTMAFGIVAHNSAEWNILLRLQFGKTAYVRNSTNVVLIMYYTIMLLAMATLRLDHLLYFSMIQGGFLDWTFVCFTCAAYKSLYDKDTHEHVLYHCFKNEHSRFVFWYGVGAVFHLVSVEILFAGFILNDAKLIGLGGFFLLPMFLFYTIWVFNEERLMLFCGPSVFMNYVRREKPASAPTKFLITPFKHTTRTVDILYKRLVGEGYAPIQKVDVEMKTVDVVKLEQVGSDTEVEMADDTSAQVLSRFSRRSNCQVEDCESFKFGINDQCCCYKLPRIPCCCSKCWIPCYWIIALTCISINAGVLIQLPKWTSHGGCNEGYDYGAW